MANIQILDQHTINKIAAGEVIERPASIVKELVENAIDAGANAITVEIKEGGIGFIRITDNGCGIEKSEVKTAFLRHATSKIRAVEDLITISSLGFRGEALSSIAAVAQVELLTKTANALNGVRYLIEGGRETAMEEVGCPEGTTFLIRNLFFNVPARRKFLKAPATEASHIDTLISRLALSHPDISIKFINNSQNKLYTSGNGNSKDIIYHIFGREITTYLIPLHAVSENIKISGYIGKPNISRGNRTYETYFVNGRYIKSDIINQAIEEGYKTYTMVHKYPFVVLNFEINSEWLDVNVHPSKMELRFKNGEELYQFIVVSIRQALMEKELIPTISVDNKNKIAKRPEPIPKVPEPFESKRIEQEVPKRPKVNPLSMRNKEIADPIVEAAKEAVDALIPDQKDISYDKELIREEASYGKTAANENIKTEKHAEQMNLFAEKLLSEEARPKHRIIGQLFQTYWLIEYENKLFIMDQHAAHEKVMYEKLIQSYKEKEIYSQQLAPPMVVTLNMKEITALNEYGDYFIALGFVIEAFGGDEYCIRAVPANLYGLGEEELFIEFMDAISDEIGITDPDIITNKIASMSCKAAVKGNMKLSYSEADALIGELLTLANPYTCPHGRPTIISMTQTELEKKFSRIQ